MLSQIEKAKAKNRPFDYDSLIDFVKVLPNANKAELEEIKAEIEAEIEKEFYLPDIVAEQNIRAGYLGALAIVDKHINKADCNNDCEHCEWTECPKY